MAVPRHVLARRLKTAIAYSPTPAKELAAQFGVSESTLSRMANDRAPIDTDDIEKVPRLTGVPRRFMVEGFASLEVLTLPEWAEHLEARMAELEARLPTTPLDEEAADPPSDLGHELEEESPSEEDDDQSDESTDRGK